MADPQDDSVPDITLTSTTTPTPQVPNITTVQQGPTTTTTTQYAISPRRHRNTNATDTTRSTMLTVPGSDDVEPFPTIPSPNRSGDQEYFPSPQRIPQTPLQYQVRHRPIGLRRITSQGSVNDIGGQARLPSVAGSTGPVSNTGSLRRRTNTAPSQRVPAIPENATANLAALPGHYEMGSTSMQPIVEGEVATHTDVADPAEGGTRVARSGSRLRRISNAARSSLSKLSDDPEEERLRRGEYGHEYESEVIDYLDVLDPEVSTLTTLNNIQNAMFVPDIPFLNRYINRRPTYELSRPPSRIGTSQDQDTRPHRNTITRQVTRKPIPASPGPPEASSQPQSPDRKSQPQSPDKKFAEDGTPTKADPNEMLDEVEGELIEEAHQGRRFSITSQVDEKHYAVLPHGVELDGWTQEDIDELDDYVRHMLHSRRSRFKRSMRAFGKYISKPLGFFVTLYAFLITIFGLIWVLFLIGWISVGDRKSYIVNVIDNVLVALFAVMGDGLAPFRAIDTYHMIYIAHYHRLSWKLRKEKHMPKLSDHNDLPERTEKEVTADAEAGLEKTAEADWEFSVLTPEQQKKLVHHQNKFSKSHSYYRPHETTTHYAFPLKLLITIVSLCDAHSVLQIMLGSFTWAWSYHTRPNWITSVILSFSITVNVLSGVVISIGDRKTRKKDVLLRMARQGLTEEAMRKVEKHKREREEAAARGEGSTSGDDAPKKSFSHQRVESNSSLLKAPPPAHVQREMSTQSEASFATARD